MTHNYHDEQPHIDLAASLAANECRCSEPTVVYTVGAEVDVCLVCNREITPDN